MHKSVIDWVVYYLASKNRSMFNSDRILECGSLDVNGSLRVFFEDKEYIGVDWRPGKGVDCVSLIHEYRDKPDEYFDLVISTEMLEHDPHWKKSIQRMLDLLKIGGNLIFI